MGIMRNVKTWLAPAVLLSVVAGVDGFIGYPKEMVC